jgi:hypothetical protein
MVRTDVVLIKMPGSRRLQLRVTPVAHGESSRNVLNREEAEKILLSLGLVPADIQGTFEILEASEDGTPVSFGAKDLDEELLRENGFYA